MSPTRRQIRDQQLIDLWEPCAGNRSEIARRLGLTRARVAQLVCEIRARNPQHCPDDRPQRAAQALSEQRHRAIERLKYIRTRLRRPLERARAMREAVYPDGEPTLSSETTLRYGWLLKICEYGPNSFRGSTPPVRPEVQHWCRMFVERDESYAQLLEIAQMTNDLKWLQLAAKRPSHHTELLSIAPSTHAPSRTIQSAASHTSPRAHTRPPPSAQFERNP